MDAREMPPPALSSTLFLDGGGEVVVSLNSDGLTITPLDPDSPTCCAQTNFRQGIDANIQLSDIYAVELIEMGPITRPWSASKFLRGEHKEMHRFSVHSVIRKNNSRSPWLLKKCTLGHEDLRTCESWVDLLNSYIESEHARPKSLLVFVHPLCGKGNGCKTWDMVAPLFSRAKVQTKVTVTQRAGHAYDIIASLSNDAIRSFDGIVSVGGDGLFNEILNGLLSSRHNGSYPPTPTEFSYIRPVSRSQEIRTDQRDNAQISEDTLLNDSVKHDDCEPLLSTAFSRDPDTAGLNEDNSITFPNEWLRLGIIPSGSTDAIVLSTTGVRDPVTSAMQIIFGRKLSLDIAQVVRWKASPSSNVLPCVRYAASFAGYGFYGEVVKQSEKHRWMGPMRYDYTGTLVFLQHRSYEAQVAFLDVDVTSEADFDTRPPKSARKSLEKLVCRSKCAVCDGSKAVSNSVSSNLKWCWSKGQFLSVGAAVISCRNERAPNGLVADAHLSDGFLHLILIRDCPRPSYLWHLTRFSSKGSDPFNFSFVEHHKTLAFTFLAPHDESVWNLDGEIFQASEVSVQVCRGLINLFASGPEV